MKKEPNFKKILSITLVAIWAIVFSVYTPQTTVAEQIDTMETNEVNMIKGELVELKVYQLTRLSISDPEVADIANADADQLLIVGKTVGQTLFFIWDENGKRTIVVRVFEEDLNMVKFRIDKLIRTSDLNTENVKVEVNNYEGKVIVSGTAVEETRNEINRIVSEFGGNVLNMLREEPEEDLVQIDMQITELNETLLKNLGFDWSTGSNDSIVLGYEETLPSAFDDQLDRLVKVGQFNRTTALLSQVNLLVSEGKGRILSKPSLVVVSGKEASFQVGGQIPIRTTSTSSAGGTSQENVEFKDFGIILNITPTIQEGKVDVELDIEVSDIDAANAVGDDVAFTNRSAQTHLLLEDGQTIVMAGLIKQSRGETIRKVPFIGDIPIVGMLFRNKFNPAADQDTELVISMKPTILYAEDSKDETEDLAAEEDVLEDWGLKETLADIDESMKDVMGEDYSEEYKEDNSDMVAAKGSSKGSVRGSSTGGEREFFDESPKGSMKNEPKGSHLEGHGSHKGSMKETADVEDTTQDIGDVRQTRDAADDGDPYGDELMDIEHLLADESLLGLDDAVPGEEASETMTQYVHYLQSKISQSISYPYEAVERGWAGTVKVTLRILKDGTLDEISIKESSGHTIFDKDALNTAQILAPFAAFPPDLDLEEIIVTIPIVYSQESSSFSGVSPEEVRGELSES